MADPSATLHYIRCVEYGHLRTWNIRNTGKTLYWDRSHVHVVEIYLLSLDNKQRIMPNYLQGDSTLLAHAFVIA